MLYQDVLNFWFQELKPKHWFGGGEEIDGMIRSRFLETHARAARCEHYAWRSAPEGRLAEIIVLDQFSRNIYRGSAHAFASDPLALALAQEAVSLKVDQSLSVNQRAFLYMPFMHSESREIHEVAVKLFSAKGLETNLDFEHRHKDIIDRFGRYPHRNAVLGRASTPEEIEFLKGPGSGF